MKTIQFNIVEHGTLNYVEVVGDEAFVESEKDIVALLGVCADHNADRILLNGVVLAPTFFDLRSGLAGDVLQKLVNYQVKTAAVLSQEQIRGKFAHFVVETNRGHHFRVFFNRQDAEDWLVNDEPSPGTCGPYQTRMAKHEDPE